MTSQELNDFLRLNKMNGKELAAKLGVHYVTVSRWRNEQIGQNGENYEVEK